MMTNLLGLIRRLAGSGNTGTGTLARGKADDGSRLRVRGSGVKDSRVRYVDNLLFGAATALAWQPAGEPTGQYRT
jgi:hypothetical protein